MIAQSGQCYLNVMVRWLGLSYHRQVWTFESCPHLWEDIFKLESNFQSPTRFSEQKWTWRFHRISKKSRKGQNLGSSLAWKVKEVQLWHVCFKLLSCGRWELSRKSWQVDPESCPRSLCTWLLRRRQRWSGSPKGKFRSSKEGQQETLRSEHPRVHIRNTHLGL